jgi:hypothetical protein
VSICWTVKVSVYLFRSLSVYPSLYLLDCQSIRVYLFRRLSVHPSVYLLNCQSIRFSVSLCMSAKLSNYLFIYFVDNQCTVCLFAGLSKYPSLSISQFISVSVCLPARLSKYPFIYFGLLLDY